MNMISLLSNPENVQIEIGEPLTPTTGQGTTYQYQLVSFKDTRVQMWSKKDGPDRNLDTIRGILKDTQDAIFVVDLENAAPETASQVGNKMWEIVKKYPSGVVNKNGAIMQQIIIPNPSSEKSGNSDQPITDIDNGLNITQPQDQKAYGDGALNWNCNLEPPYPRAGFRVSNKQGCGFIANSNGRTQEDNVSYENRQYTVSPQSPGSFALMLHFVGSPTIKQASEKPKVVVDINQQKAIITASQTSDVIFQVGDNSITGSLTSSDTGYNVPHIQGNSEIKPTTLFVYPIFNGLVLTSNISGSVNDQSALTVRISDKGYSPFSSLDPTLKEFPNKFKKKPKRTPIKLVDTKKTSFTFGPITLTWTNIWGNFCYCPVYFAKKTKFYYVFKGYYQGTTPSGASLLSGDFSYLAVPIFSSNYSSSNSSLSNSSLGESVGSTMDDCYEAELLYNDEQNMVSWYCFEFDISDTKRSRKPGQMFGFVKILKRTGPYSQVKNDDGEFSITPSPVGVVQTTKGNFDYDQWYNYITQVSVRTGLDGISGSVTLDKYAFYTELGTDPQQCIGALTLIAKNGPYGAQTLYHPYPLGEGVIFTGYALDIQNSVSQSSDTLTINLAGVDRKLDDIKLVNCPFWDGDLLFEEQEENEGIIQYFRDYTGCNLDFVQQFCNTAKEDFRVPASWDYQSPAVDFQLGKSCLQALRQLAEMCNLQFVIQPNGHGYFYEMNKDGVPYYILQDYSDTVHDYKPTEIISMNISPYLENKYNTFITMGYLVKRAPNGQVNPLQISVNPGIFVDYAPLKGSNFPWSRIKSSAAPGYLTREELRKFHNSNMRFGTADVYTGSITVPGYAGYGLFDRISIDNVPYYIHQIGQQIDLQNKTWTTTLSVAKYNG